MARNSFKNLGQLFNAVQKTLESSAKTVGVQGKKIVKDQIDKDVYLSYTPKYYKRTGQLKSSIRYTTMKHNNGFYVLFDHDKTKIDAKPPSKINNYMGQHHSTAKKYVPQQYDDYVAMVVHNGNSGHIFGEGEWTKPRPYMENARVHVATMANSIVKQKLHDRGFNIK